MLLYDPTILRSFYGDRLHVRHIDKAFVWAVGIDESLYRVINVGEATDIPAVVVQFDFSSIE